MASIWGSLENVSDGSLKGSGIKGADMPGGSLGYKADNFLQRKWKTIWDSQDIQC